MRLITDEQHAQIVEALTRVSDVDDDCDILSPNLADTVTETLATLQALPEVEVIAWRTKESAERKPKYLDEWFYASNKAYTEVHKFKWVPLYATKEPS